MKFAGRTLWKVGREVKNLCRFRQGQLVLSKNLRRNKRLDPLLNLAAQMGQKGRAFRRENKLAMASCPHVGHGAGSKPVDYFGTNF